jgi:hypothetical protein
MTEQQWEDADSRELADEPLFQPPAGDDAAEAGLGDGVGDIPTEDD